MRDRRFLDHGLIVLWVSLSFLVALFLLVTYSPKEHIQVLEINGGAGKPAHADPRALFPDGTIDPNTAEAEAFLIVPGIGEKTAAAILAEREANGPFYFPEDLLAVKGIGQKKLESLRPFLCFPDLNGE